MKKFFGVFLFTILILNGGAAYALNNLQPTPFVKITPASFFWNIKLFGEYLKEKVVSLGGKEAEIDYLGQRIGARINEMNQMNNDGLVDSAPRIKALNKKEELENDYITLLNELVESKRIKIAKLENEIEYNEDEPQLDYSNLITNTMAGIRQQILDAQKNGDEKRQADLINELEDIKKNYDDAGILLLHSQENEKQHLEQTENMLSGADKVSYGLDWVEKYRKMIDDTSKRPEYQSGKDLFKDAQKTIDDLESGLKQIPLDKVDNKALDDLFGNAAQKLNDTARAIWQKNQNDELTKQLPQEYPGGKMPKTPETPPKKKLPVEPQPPEQPPKKVLKTIPSESVQTNPLTLYIWRTPQEAHVGIPFSGSFGADGGLPPYHFQLDTMGGFPPLGIFLDINGEISGTPSAAGTSKFEVCVVDTAGNYVCGTATIVVSEPAPQVVVPPPTAQAESSFTFTGSTCMAKNSYQNNMSLSGEAKGPVGSQVKGTYVASCGSWGLDNVNFTCTRRAGDPEETRWTFTSFSNYTIKMYFNYPRGIGEIYGEKTIDVPPLNCP